MAKRGIGRAIFRSGAFLVLVAAPIGGFASLPPDTHEADQASTDVARARAACDAAAAPFARLFPPVDRPTRGRADRACAGLASSDDPSIVRAADRAARALVREENDLAWHMLGVLAICALGAFLAVCGIGVGAALYGVAAIVVAAWGGVHIWPCLVGAGTALLALPCTPWPGTPAEERVPAPGPAALLTAGVGALWSLPVLSFLLGRLHLATGPRLHHVVLLAELAAGGALVLVVVPSFVHFFRSRGEHGWGPAAKLGATVAGVVAVVAGALAGYAIARGS